KSTNDMTNSPLAKRRLRGTLRDRGQVSQPVLSAPFGTCIALPGRKKMPGMALEFTTSYLKDSIDVLHYYKRLAERAIAQVPDEALVAAPDSESNSIAIIVKHLAGNMRSRFTDFLTSDGEKPDRKRDTEFEAPP